MTKGAVAVLWVGDFTSVACLSLSDHDRTTLTVLACPQLSPNTYIHTHTHVYRHHHS